MIVWESVVLLWTLVVLIVKCYFLRVLSCRTASLFLCSLLSDAWVMMVFVFSRGCCLFVV
jgi:hypothetical protein